MVSLTLMLVIVTIVSAIQLQLPATPYLKVDIISSLHSELKNRNIYLRRKRKRNECSAIILIVF